MAGVMMASIGDKVRYREFEVEVINIEFRNELNDMRTSCALNGELCYFVGASEFDRAWVLASECDLSDASEFYEQDTRSPHLTDLGYNMVGWLDGLEPHQDNDKLPPIISLLLAIQYDKEGSYGSSWCGKGEYRGIMANIDRKYDRLDKMTDDEIAGSLRPLHEQEEFLVRDYDLYSEQVGESKIDAIADLANYCLLYLTYVREKYPRVFGIWVKRNVPAYLADKIPFV